MPLEGVLEGVLGAVLGGVLEGVMVNVSVPEVAAWREASESFAVTLNEEVSLDVGVPLIAPLMERANPAGKEPEARLQV